MYNLKIKAETESFVTEEYGTFGWPIKYFDKAQNLNEEYNYTSFNLRIDDNTKPLLFVENTDLFIQNNTSRFVDEQKLLNGTSTDWSNAITLKFPNAVKGTIKENIAYYIKLQYFRQEFNPTSPNTVLRNENYFDSAFCPIDLPNIANNDYKLEQVYNPNLNYVRGRLSSISDEFGSVTSSGAYWDNDRILFYSKAVFQNKKTGQFYSIKKGIENKVSLDSVSFKLSFLTNDLNINCKIFQEERVVNQFTPIKTISISHFNGFPSAKENLLLLGIKANEMQSLIAFADTVDPNTQLPKLSDKHHRYLFLEEDLPSPKTDKDSILFRKFKLKIQGITQIGESSIIAPDDDIFLYSRDGLCFTSKDFAESETVNDVNSFIEFIPLDTNNLYNSVRRLSMITIDTIDWQLYDLDGFPKKYDREEVNYAGDSIDNQEIKLPVGTRTIILGRSKKTINNFYCNYIVCFHEGQYREGFVNIDAFKNSNIGENNTIVRVNELEGKNHSQVIWKPFLDDAKRIIDYCERINDLLNVYQPFKDLITNTKSKFEQIISNLKPYSNPQSLIAKLQQLSVNIQSLNNVSTNNGNLSLNPNDSVDTINRWLNFPPLKNLIIDNVTGGFQTFVLPISRQWFVKWKDSDAIFKNIFYDNTEYTTPNKSQYKFSDILNALSGTGATNVPVSEEQEHFLIKHVLKTLIVSFKNRTDSLAITKTSEAIWLKSLDENSIDNIPNFISIWSDTWNDTKGSSINLSYILSDHSIGYINSISGLSCLIHEINTFHDVSNPLDSTKYSGKALFYDTHGADEFLLEFSTIQQHLQNNNSALGYFNNFQSVNPQNHNGPWLALFTNPHNAILYLNYYSTKILQL